MLFDDIAHKTTGEVCQIYQEIEEADIADYMLDHVVWYKTAKNRPDMTAEEIASAAADGFRVRNNDQ